MKTKYLDRDEGSFNCRSSGYFFPRLNIGRLSFLEKYFDLGNIIFKRIYKEEVEREGRRWSSGKAEVLEEQLQYNYTTSLGI